MINIPEKVFVAALTQAIKETIDVEEFAMLSTADAAKLLKITPQALRAIAADHFDLGERRTRWSLSDIRTLLESRRVKNHKKA